MEWLFAVRTEGSHQSLHLSIHLARTIKIYFIKLLFSLHDKEKQYKCDL